MSQVKDGGGKAELKTVEGETLTVKKAGKGLTVTDAKGDVAHVTTANVMQSNGVVHVIDTVLQPGRAKSGSAARPSASSEDTPFAAVGRRWRSRHGPGPSWLAPACWARGGCWWDAAGTHHGGRRAHQDRIGVPVDPRRRDRGRQRCGDGPGHGLGRCGSRLSVLLISSALLFSAENWLSRVSLDWRPVPLAAPAGGTMSDRGLAADVACSRRGSGTARVER